MAVATDCNFAARLTGRLGRHSFLIDAATGQTISPDQLPGLIAGYARGFSAAGLRPGDPVLIGTALSPSSGLAYLGAMFAGLVAVPVEERSLAATGEGLAKATGAKAVWTEQSFNWKWTQELSVLQLHGDLTGGTGETMSPVPRDDSDLAALMATSGSTGVPRFLRITHGNLIANTEAIIRSQHLGDEERAMLILPLSYCFGASVFHTHLYQGGGVVFDRRFMFPDKVLQAMNQHGCTTFAGVPTAYHALLHRSKARTTALPQLRRLLQAGGPLAEHLIKEIRNALPTAKFYVMYGQTEATARIACLDPARLEEKLGSVGRPLDNLTVRIANERGEELPQGEVGEIWVKGPSISQGYHNDPVESERAFRDGWLRTGDLARMDEDGYLWIQGRLGSFVKMRGTRVSFTEAEARVMAMPEVFECAATGTSHPEAGEALILFVVLREGAKLALEDIRRHLPAHWALDSVHFVAELPKNTHGKVSRTALKAKPRLDHEPA
ncbi:MAG TPA: class I adenylate-forming enzyme family protein [Verrucomicrobiae bacterium]|nr:class I adenylate-forming enzyme family protein [Verrucomicrobiae bacterium]